MELFPNQVVTHPDKMLSTWELVRVIGDIPNLLGLQRKVMHGCFLGYCFDVAGPSQMAGDIYSDELVAFDHLCFGTSNVDWALSNLSFPEVNHKLLCLAVIEG